MSNIKDAENKAVKLLAGYEAGTFTKRAAMGGGDYPADFRKTKGRQVYTVKIINADASETHTALLCPGINGVATQGSIKTGAMTSVEAADTDNLSASTTNPGSIEDFLKFIQDNPAEVLGIQMKSTKAEQSGEQMSINQFSPFKTLEDEYIDLDMDEDNKTDNDKVSVLDLRGQGVQFDHQTKIKLPVVGASTLVVKIFFGSIFNQAAMANRVITG